jgi:hypothetical protein
MFGGSMCDRCGGRLLEKQSDQSPKVVHVTQDMILGAPKHLKSELAQSMSGRVFRLLVEVVLFCVVFYGVSWLGHVVANFLHIHMSERPEKTPPLIVWFVDDSWQLNTGVRYYLYVGWAIVTVLTIKFRWRAGK